MYWRGLRALGLILALIITAFVGVAPPASIAAPAPAGQVGFAVTPVQAVYTSQPTFVMNGAGYTPGEPISISGGPFSNFQINADGSGAFTTTRQSDSDTGRYGSYAIKATGSTSNTSYTFDVFLTRFDIYNNTQSGNMAVTAGGSVNLTLRGWGFGRSEAVVLSSNPPGLFATVNTSADSNGYFNVANVNTNAAAAAGLYQIVATGGTSGFVMTQPFNVLSAQVSPQQLQAGQHPVVTVSASGLTPGGDVTVSGGPFGSSVTKASPSGQISIQEPVVSNTAGRYSVKVLDNATLGYVTVPLYLSALGLYWNPVSSSHYQYYDVSGFQPGEVVRLTAAPPGHITFDGGADHLDVTTDSAGNTSWHLSPVGAVPPGQYTFTALGLTSGYTATNLLAVTGTGLSVTPMQVVAPAVGQQFALSGSGFAPNEYVDITDANQYWNPFTSAGYGNGNALALTIQADSSGLITTTLQSNGGAGRQDLRAHGRSSGVDNYASVYLTGIDLQWGSFVAANTAKSQYFQGYGFKDGETVQLTTNPVGLFPSATVTANGGGNFVYTAPITQTAAGDYQIIATGQTSGYVGVGLYHVGSFALSPNAFPAGVAADVTFSGAGFTPNETVDVWNDYHGSVFPDFSVTADANGAFSVTRTMAGNGWSSNWAWTRAKGRVSGIQQDQQIHPLSLSGSLSRAVAGSTAAVSFYVRAFAQSGSVHLSSSPSGLFTEKDVALDGNGNVNASVTLLATALTGTYTVLAQDSSNGFSANTSFAIEAAAGNPMLHVDTTPRLFNANAGDTQAQSANVSIDNQGGAVTLNWQSAVSTASGGAWLSVNPTSATINANGSTTFSVQVNPTGLASGIYTGTVTVNGQAGTVNSPRSFLVTLGIQGGTSLTMSPNHATAGDYPTVTLSASGFGPHEAVDITGGPWASFMDYTDDFGNLSRGVQVTTYNSGQYNVTIKGRSSGLQTSALFSLTGVTANPTGARSGQSTALKVSGVGYVEGETVSVSSSPAGLFPTATATADANGAFNFASTIPDSAATGQYQIIATGTSGYTAQTPFNLSTLSVTPGQVSQQGLQLQVSAAGYKPSEQIHFWLAMTYWPYRDPVDTTLVADGNGVITATVTLPPDSYNGWYVATARGNISGMQNTTSFYQTGVAFDKSLVSANTPSAAQLSGGGFRQGEAVNLASSPSGLFSAPPVAADVNGNFAVSLSINAPAGFYHVVASGATSGFNAATDLHVGTLSVTPAWQVAGGSTPLNIQSSGYAANDTVHIGQNNGSTAPFEDFDAAVDASGVLTVTRQATNTSARRFDVQVWDDRGALSTAPYYQVSSYLDAVNGTFGQADTFNVIGNGYRENETIQVTSNDPSLFAPVTFFASSGGYFSFPITTRATAPAGGYVLTVQGVNSGMVTTLNYHVGSFGVSPAQAAAGQLPAVQMQGSGYAPGERVYFTGGPWNNFYLQADGSGAVSIAQNVFVNTAGRYIVTATGDSGAAGQATFYLTGISLSAAQVTTGYSGNLFVNGSGFGENEPVSLSVQPSGLFTSVLPATTGPTGAVGVVARINPAAAKGAYTITLTGTRTGYAASAGFAIGSFSATPNQATKGAPGAVTLTGSGYKPGGTVHTWQGPWSDTPTTVDASGFFTGSVTVDPAKAAGLYNLRAYSYDDGTDKYTSFYLTGLSVSPSNGLVATANNLIITGAGYKEFDLVTVSAGPAGLFAPTTVVVGADGSFSLDINNDLSAPEGNYTITATGSNGYTASAPFAIGGGTASSFVSVAPDDLSVQTTNTSPAVARQITITNTGAAPVTWTASAQMNVGAGWLAVSPTSGSLDVGAGQVLTVTLTPFKLAASTYGGTITVSPSGGTGGNPAMAAVSMVTSQGQTGLTSTPRQAQYGTTPLLTLQGTGFAPNEQVTLSNGPFTSFNTTADATGAFTVTQMVSASYGYGATSIRAHGVTSGLDYYAPFNQTWLQLITPGVTAGSGSPLSVYVRGWEPYEPISLSVSPSGLVSDTVALANSSGNIGTWSLPTNPASPTGVYTVLATGQNSGMQVSVPFHVMQLIATPTTIQAGQHPLETITGYGFTPGGDVTIDHGPFGVFVVQASGSGSFDVQEQVYSTDFGSYSLRATDSASGASTTAPLNLVGIAMYYGTRAAGSDNYVSGGGFLPYEVLTAHVTPDGAVDDFTANSDSAGNFNWAHFWIKGTAANDQYTLTVTGNQSGRAAQAPLNVNGANGFSITPSVALAGSYPVVTLSAQGFSPGELVDFNSGPYTNFTLQADNSGNVTTAVQTTSASTGRWAPYARGRTSGIQGNASYAQLGAWSNVAGVSIGFTGSVILYADGFMQGESVTFQSSPGGLFAPISSVANSGGYTNPTVQVTDAAAGVYTVTALGQTSGYGASFLFVVDALLISPAQYRAGDSPLITVTEQGFQPGELVRLYDNSCGSCVFTDGFGTVADSNGTYTASFKPTGSSAGIHTLRARGDSSGINSFATLYVSQLSGPAQLVAGQAATPTFSVRGFRPRVTITLSSSPAGLFDAVTSATDDAGALDFPVALNTLALAGPYTVVATDVASGFTTSTNVLLTTAGNPIMGMDTTPHAFVATVGSTATQAQSYKLYNSGAGTMTWTSAVSTTSGGSWLSADAGGSYGSGCCYYPYVRVNPTGLPVGIYTGTLTVSAVGTDNSPQSFQVRLSVQESGSPTAAVSPAFGPINVPQRLVITGTGFNPGESVDVTSNFFDTSRTTADAGGQVSVERFATYISAGYAGRRYITLTGVSSGLAATTYYGLQRFDLSPDSAVAGQVASLTATIWGMAPSETITYTSTPGDLFTPITKTADSNGYATISISTLAAAPVGAYVIHAVGATSDSDLQNQFSVTQLSINPLQWRYNYGQTPQVFIEGTSYAPNEWVDIWARRSNNLDSWGGVPFNDFTVRTDSAGHFGVSTQVSPSIWSGDYILHARGAVSGTDFQVRFYQTDFDFRNASGNTHLSVIPAGVTTTVVLRGWGFQASEGVTLSGDTAILNGQTTAIASGAGDWQLTVPISTTAGTYSITASGDASGYTTLAKQLHVGGASVTPVQWLRYESPTLSISGLGFNPEEQVSVTGGPFDDFSVLADVTGAVNTTRRVTRTTNQQQWNLVLTGAESGLVEQVTLYQTGVTLSKTSSTATVATSFYVYGYGFKSNETLAVTSDPPGLFDATTMVADSNGYRYVYVTTRTDAPAGLYQVAVTGQTSGYQNSAQFQVVAPGAPFMTVSPGSLYFAAVQGGGAPADQNVNIGNSGAATTLSWTASVANVVGGDWLSLSSNSGTTSGGSSSTISAHADPTGLVAGTYTAQIVVDGAPGTTNGHLVVNVRLDVASPAAQLTLSRSSLTYTAFTGENPAPQSFRVSNTGGTAMDWTATPSTTSGGDWLGVSSAGGTLNADSFFDVFVEISGTALTAGTYTGSINVAGDPATLNSPKTVQVVLHVNDRPTEADMAVGPQTFSFSGQEGVPSSPSSSLTISNTGGTDLHWSSNIVTSNNTPWLTLGPSSGTVAKAGGKQVVGVNVNTNGLFAGVYTATITLSDVAALHSPQVVTATLTMSTPPPPGLHVSTNSLSFVGTQGGANPLDQQVQVSNNGGQTLIWNSAVSTLDGGNWLTLNPTHGSATGGNSNTANVHVGLAGLATGLYTGTVTISGTLGTTTSPQEITVTLKVNPKPPVPLSLQISTDKSAYSPGETLIVTGTLTQGGAPVTDATAQARLVAPDGTQQLVTLSNGGAGNAYVGSLPVGSATGNGTLYLTAGTPDGNTAMATAGVTITGHDLFFAGSQTFPTSLRQSDSGTVIVKVWNDAYVAEPSALELTDVTYPEDPCRLASLPISAAARSLNTYYLNFSAASLSLGLHTFQVNITQLPPGEPADSVTQISGQVTIVAPQPQMSVNPLAPTVSVQAGGSVSQTITVANNGQGSSLTGIQMSLESSSGGAVYPWVSLSATSMVALGYGGSSSFRVIASPPADTVPNAYQDTVIRIVTDNGGSLRLPLTVYVDSNQHTSVIFAVRDDTGQAVTDGNVKLTSTVAPYASQNGATDSHGLATFNNVSVGIPYSYNATAPHHDNATGYITAQSPDTLTVPVTLTVQAIQTTWTVVPTTIEDVYDINLQITYEVDVPIPQLAVDPAVMYYTKDPANLVGPMLLNGSSATSGEMTIYNPSRIAVNNVLVDASGVQGVNVSLTYGAVTGNQVTIPTIPPQSNVTVHYDTSAYCPLNTLSSSIHLTADYTYFKITPTLSLSENNWTVIVPAGLGSTKNQTLANTGYNVATNVTVGIPTHNWISVPHLVGNLGIGSIAPFPIVVTPPPGTPAGTYTEDLLITAGNSTPDNHLTLSVTLASDGSFTVEGAYIAGSVPPSTGHIQASVPVVVYDCTTSSGGSSGGGSSGGGAPALTFTSGGGVVFTYPSGGVPPNVTPPPPPQPMAHEVVKLEIPQKATMERQAFIAELQTTNTSGITLDNFQVTINVADTGGAQTNSSGQRYVDLFALTAPTESGYTGNHAIGDGQTADSQWTLIPSAGLGGTDPAGTHYKVSATYCYSFWDPGSEFPTTICVTTDSVDITIYPMPNLRIDYYVPRDIKANHPVKLGVVVHNIGAGPAKNLTIVSGQPHITENLGGLLITFALLDVSVNGNPAANNLTMSFGDVPANSYAWGYWDLVTDVDGQVTAFTATYTQHDYQGAVLSPLITAVHTFIIVQGNVTPAGGQSLEVVADGEGIPPSVLINLTTGGTTPVTTVYVDDSMPATPQVPTTTLCITGTGWIVAVVPDPMPAVPLKSVHAHYGDGTSAELYTGNNLVWRGSDPQGNKVYIVDQIKGGSVCYSIGYDVPISMLPDLSPTSLLAPSTAEVGQSFPVTFTVMNLGHGDAVPPWTDVLYLSQSPNPIEGVALITTTHTVFQYPGTSYDGTAMVTLPDVPDGDYYLVYLSNAKHQLVVAGIVAPAIAVPIALTKCRLECPDLTPTTLQAQTTALAGQTVPITFSVTNQGLRHADPSWHDVLSLRSSLLAQPVVLLDSIHANVLAMGETYTVTSNVTMPANLVSGSYTVTLTTDDSNQVAEETETNNIRFTPITIQGPQPDLHPIDMAAPSPALAGQTIPITYTVKNQGAGDAVAPWHDKVYLAQVLDATSWPNAVAISDTIHNTSLAVGDSYTVTTNVTIPDGTTSGLYYLVVNTDDASQVTELDETNNARSAWVTIQVLKPDLVPVTFTTPANGKPGQTVPITWTVNNQGSGAVLPSWQDRVYLSTDDAWDSGDTVLTIVTQTASLSAGSSYTVSTNVSLPKATGTYYLILRSDMWNQVVESDETNNQQIAPITVTLPDLALTASTTPATGLPGQTVPITWTVTNQGDGAALPSWQDRVYLSTDDMWDSGDTALTIVTQTATLPAGTSYTTNRNVTLPRTVGSYYLILRTDMWGQVAETDELNNEQVVPIAVQAPDLTPIAFETPSTGRPGQTVPISWTVINQGNADALPTWYDRVYLSTDTTWDAADVLVTNVTRTLSLAPGGSYSVSQSVSLPWVAGGSYYLLLRTDMWGQVAESDETNNQQVMPIIVGTPDLTPTSFTAPASALGWQAIPVTWTIKNQGQREAVPSWQDRIYLSTDSTYDSGDTFVTSVTHDVTVTAGSSYTVSQDVVVPPVAAGSYRLILLTDMWNQVAETDDTNNTRVVSLNVGPPDLTPTSLLSPTRAEIGTTVPLTWTIKNQGYNNALPSWYDRVYLSTDDVWDSADVFLTNVTRTLTLMPGSSYTVNQSITVPWVTSGSYYLLLRTDHWNNVAESDETNNGRAVPIMVGIPDLTPTAFTAPTSAIGWQTITPTWTIKNQGHGDASPSWQDRIYLSTDNVWDSGDTFLTTVTHGVTLTGGSSYTVTQSVVVPKVTPGGYYLLLRTDMWDQVSEIDETNNLRVAPINIGPPDLTPTTFTSQAAAKPGQAIPITWTVKNQGLSDVLPTWYDRVYLSTDTTYDSGDIFMVNVTRTFTLVPGTSYTTTRTVMVPGVAPGNYYLLLRTDMWGNVTETSETNNERVMPLTIGLPDLTPTAFVTPATGKPWQTVPVTWTVRNQGPVEALPSWEDRVYLSTDATWDSGDIFLTKVTHSATVAAGDSYTVSANVTLPGTGTHYLIFRTDMWGQVAELNETNNSTTVVVVVAP